MGGWRVLILGAVVLTIGSVTAPVARAVVPAKSSKAACNAELTVLVAAEARYVSEHGRYASMDQLADGYITRSSTRYRIKLLADGGYKIKPVKAKCSGRATLGTPPTTLRTVPPTTTPTTTPPATSPAATQPAGTQPPTPQTQPPPPQTQPPAPPPQTQPPAPACDPNYAGACVPPYPPDVNCADVGVNNFQRIGNDPHRLDTDNDGIACEA
jgi:hypothetical protein